MTSDSDDDDAFYRARTCIDLDELDVNQTIRYLWSEICNHIYGYAFIRYHTDIVKQHFGLIFSNIPHVVIKAFGSHPNYQADLYSDDSTIRRIYQNGYYDRGDIDRTIVAEWAVLKFLTLMEKIRSMVYSTNTILSERVSEVSGAIDSTNSSEVDNPYVKNFSSLSVKSLIVLTLLDGDNMEQDEYPFIESLCDIIMGTDTSDINTILEARYDAEIRREVFRHTMFEVNQAFRNLSTKLREYNSIVEEFGEQTDGQLSGESLIESISHHHISFNILSKLNCKT